MYAYKESSIPIPGLFVHADDSRVSKAFSSVCDICVFVCPHHKTKTAETKITKLNLAQGSSITLPTN